MNPTPDLLTLVRATLEDAKGEDIRHLDVRKLTTITDHMLICTGTSSRHVQALAERVVEAVKAAGLRPAGVEGLAQGEWALVDLGEILVHLMQAQTRAHYQLEKLWDGAAPGDRDID